MKSITEMTAEEFSKLNQKEKFPLVQAFALQLYAELQIPSYEGPTHGTKKKLVQAFREKLPWVSESTMLRHLQRAHYKRNNDPRGDIKRFGGPTGKRGPRKKKPPTEEATQAKAA